MIIMNYCDELTFGIQKILDNMELNSGYLIFILIYGTVIVDCSCMLLAVVLYWIYLCRSQLYSSTFPNSFCFLPFDSYQTLFLSLRYKVFPFPCI